MTNPTLAEVMKALIAMCAVVGDVEQAINAATAVPLPIDVPELPVEEVIKQLQLEEEPAA